MISLGSKHDIEAIVQAELATSPRSLSRMVGIPPGCVRGGVATPRYGADLAGTKQVWIFGSQPLPTSVSLPRTRSGQPDGLVRKMSTLAISTIPPQPEPGSASASTSASSSSTLAEALSTAPTSFMSTGKGITFGSTRSQKCLPAANKVSPVTIVCQSDGNGVTVTASSEASVQGLPERSPLMGEAQATDISEDVVGSAKPRDVVAKPCTPPCKGPSLLSQTAPKLEAPLTRPKSSISSKGDKDMIEVKIGDLGNASYCWKHFTENIQTRQYRCPEVILGAEWDATADVWSVGCIFFELLTSDVLFDPAERVGAWSRDDDHICQMIELLGPMDPRFALSGDYSKEIFRSDGGFDPILSTPKDSPCVRCYTATTTSGNTRGGWPISYSHFYALSQRHESQRRTHNIWNGSSRDFIRAGPLLGPRHCPAVTVSTFLCLVRMLTNRGRVLCLLRGSSSGFRASVSGARCACGWVALVIIGVYAAETERRALDAAPLAAFKDSIVSHVIHPQPTLGDREPQRDNTSITTRPQVRPTRPTVPTWFREAKVWV
ncbi:Pkinase domain-containing protein [Rhizoctonia solani AG-1 IA]|uniref:non-specific serine/threonine protein kinase n=1 Tax=Thanatephorus cucumeris (strain AG1-IA) TaxID=983506 RepID=L8WYA2_THACA|nr:Pkinase domain-containing protein [Rhizoctonia solani AG-1 IA]